MRAGRDLILAMRAGHAKIRSVRDLILALTEFNFSAYLILARTKLSRNLILARDPKNTKIRCALK